MNCKTFNALLLFLLFTNCTFAQYAETDLSVSSVGDVFYAVNSPTGKLKDYFPYYGCFGYGFIVSFKRFSAEYNSFESSDLQQLKKDFEFNGPWLKEIPTRYTSKEIILGFSPYQGELSQVSILAGGYIPRIVASEYYISKHKVYKDMSVSSSLSPQIGLSYDLFLPLERYMVRRTQKSNYYFHFRTRVIYQVTNYSSTTNELKGGFVSVQVACGISWKVFIDR